MDTAEARTTIGGEAGGSGYDAFISYSHSTDELLAPRLQAGLQRFAKPWWKRRALRIFRDEASLSANPHLWSSITEALDESAWFVLLLSPDAAESPWVDREVEYWLEGKESDRIIPVLTAGEFAWVEGDLVSDAAPPSLRGAFADEPRWVDLRFAHSEEQLDLKNPRFSAAVADIASAIRGVPKDELESEEVRQHRRTIRTAWAAGIALAVLVVLATAAAVFAFNQQAQAEQQAERADEQARLADEQRQIAEDQTELARENARQAQESESRALEQERIARTGELATAAQVTLEANPERSILLALAAVETARSGVGPDIMEPVSALRQALAASRVASRVAGGKFVDYSPDGTTLATGFGVDTAIWDADTYQQIRLLPSPDGRRPVNGAFSSDGAHLAVTYRSIGESGPLALVWDLSTGEIADAIDGPESINPRPAYSTDGTLLAVESVGPLLIWDVVAGTERYRIDHGPERHAWGPSFSPDGTLLAVSDFSDQVGSRVVLYDAATGTELYDLDAGELNPIGTAFDPSGRYLAALSQTPAHVLVWDLEVGARVVSLPLDGGQTTVEWHPGGEVFAVSGNEGIPRLMDVATGTEILALIGHDDAVWSVAFSPDGAHLAGAGFERETTLVWSITAGGPGEVATLATPYPNFWVQGVRYDADGDSILVTAGQGTDTTVARLDAATGEVLAEIPNQFGGWPRTPILAPRAGLVASLNNDFTAALHDEETFAPLLSLPEGRYALAVSRDGTRALLASTDFTEAEVAEVGSWEVLMTLEDTPVCFGDFSPDGSLLSAYNCSAGGDTWLIDVDNETYLATYPPPVDEDDPGWIVAHFSPDGALLAMRTLDGRVGLLDVAALRAGAAPEDAMLVDFDAHDGLIPDNVPFSPDGSLFATWGLIDGHLRVWGTENGELVADLGKTAGWPGFDFHPNGRHLIAEGADGSLHVFTLDLDELVEIARSRVTRGFTADECDTYRFDPCPNLEQIRRG